MGKVKSFLTVYTVTQSELYQDGVVHCTAGSWLRRGDAIRECADLIIKHLENCPHMRIAASEEADMGEKNSMKEALLEKVDADEIGRFFDDGMEISTKLRKALRSYLVDVIGGAGYFVCANHSFDVDENDVECSEGLQLWTCIRSGIDSEQHDPEFEQAYPEVFLSRQAAVGCMVDDLKTFLGGYEPQEEKAILAEAKERIAEHGHFEFDLNDQKQCRWDIWSTPLDIGQGSGKIQRI